MESNLWSNRHSTASSRRYHHQSRSGLFVLFYIEQKYWKKCCRTTPFDSFCCWNFDSCTDLFIGGGYDETDGDDDLNAMFLCPFCAEDFDIVGLCCHIDEDHPIEAKNGVKFWYIYFTQNSRKGISIIKLLGDKLISFMLCGLNFKLMLPLLFLWIYKKKERNLHVILVS